MRTFLLLLIILGLIILQIYLSKRKNKWIGLILPIIAFLFGLLYPLNMMAPSEGMTANFIFQLIMVWVLGNIPTVVLLVIYFICKSKRQPNNQIDKS